MYRKKLSVRRKIVLLTCSMTLLASVLIGGFAYYRIANITIETAIDGLAGETRLIALKFKESYDEMGNDLFIVDQTPPIEGIIRSYKTGIDPKDGSTLEIWKNRLETIFHSIMEARTHYTQMRYIGVADRGSELVRVLHTKLNVEPISPEALRQKWTHPYFQEALKLKKGERYISDIAFSQEYEEEPEVLVPVVRTIIPVYHGERMFGLLVINADYRLLLERAFAEINTDKTTLVVNNEGDYSVFDPQRKNISFEFHDRYTKVPPPFVDAVKNAVAEEQVFHDRETITYFVKLHIDPSHPQTILTIGLRASKATLMKNAYRTQLETLILAAAIAAISLLAAALAARKITAPLQEMTRSIAQAQGGDLSALKLPVYMPDEIGELARAFQRLTHSLQRSEAKVRDVLNNVIDGIITIDEKGVIESINPACENIFGYSAEEVIGKNIKMLMPEPYRGEHDQYIRNYKDTGQKKIIGIGREVMGRRKNGREFPMDLSVSETTTSDMRLFTGIVRDITERKEMEIMKDEFISTVNHELRTPLTSIQTSLGLLRVDLEDTLDADGKRVLELAYNNCTRLSQLVNDILDIEKIAAGKMEYVMEDVEMTTLVKEMVEQHGSYASKYGVHFMVESDFESVTCRVDSNRFTQALVNLLSNAAKFSPEGETVTVSLEAQGKEKLRLSVADKGPGIPEDFKKKIFTKFAQADGSSTRAKGGTGLGLNITRSIIEAFGGEVGFESEKGKGTTFYFVLPIGKATAGEKEPDGNA